MTKVTKVSERGRDFLKKEEGVRYEAYQDIYGNWTTGVGHLIKDDEKHLILEVLDHESVEQLLTKDILNHSVETAKLNDTVGLKQHQFDSLVSFEFNIGGYRARNSELFRYIKNGGEEPHVINKLFQNWNSRGDLIGRRKREADLYNHAQY